MSQVSKSRSALSAWSSVIAVLLCLAVLFPTQTRATIFEAGSHPNNRTVYGDGTLHNYTDFFIGSGGGNLGFAGLAYFELPELRENNKLTDANLEFWLTGGASTVAGNVDVWGLGYSSGIPPTTPPPANWYFDEETDTRTGNDLGTNIGTATVTKIANNFIPSTRPAAPPLEVNTTSAQDITLAGWVQSLYDDHGAQAGDYAIVRLNLDYYDPGTSSGRYHVGSSKAPAGQQPVLSLDMTIDNSLITATASSYWTGSTPHRTPQQAVNGDGLTGMSHNNAAQNVWLSAATPAGGGEEWFRVDLGDLYELDAVRVWNDTHSARAVAQADIYSSDFNPLVDGDPGNPDDNPANWTLEIEDQTFLPGVAVSQDVIDLSGITARYIAFAIDVNHGVTENLVGWGELQFSGTVVPEPRGALLALLAALGLAIFSRRRRK